MTDKIKVGIEGPGAIGKRLAEAVSVQPDMTLVGISGFDTKDIAKLTYAKYPTYATIDQGTDRSAIMKAAGIEVLGTLEDLARQADVVVDATLKGLPETKFDIYRSNGAKIIVEGGESHGVTGHSSSAFANYEATLGVDQTRVVSCNTTGLSRTLSTLDRNYGIQHVNVSLIRRANDPSKGADGATDVVIPVLGGSHHYEDVESVMPHLEDTGYSQAVAVPTTHSHVHTLSVQLQGEPTAQDIADLFSNTPRYRVINGEEGGITDTALITQFYQDLGRPRGDNPEITLWADSIHMAGNHLSMIFNVHNESIPIPENIDAIRAMMGKQPDKWESIKTTDYALDTIMQDFAKPAAMYKD
tara:strand:+ start:41542 stop:42612 length:1071 start_codon:yes stop_codon:yes gene_type:complete